MAKAMSIKLPRKKPSTPRKPKFADESYTGPRTFGTTGKPGLLKNFTKRNNE